METKKLKLVINTDFISKQMKVSYSTAVSIRYGFFENFVIYKNRGNNSSNVVANFKKHFDAIFESGNDAPRGGKNGDFYKMVSCDKVKFNEFVEKLEKLNNAVVLETEKRKENQQKAINNLNFSVEEISKFKSKIYNQSNRTAKKIANNFVAKKLGFYSLDGVAKLLKSI